MGSRLASGNSGSVLILCATSDEGSLIRSAMLERTTYPYKRARFFSGELAENSVVLGVTGVGLDAARDAVQFAMERLRVRFVLVIGYCGALDSEFRVADIAVPSEVIADQEGNPIIALDHAKLTSIAEEVIAEISWDTTFKPGLRFGKMISVTQMVTSREYVDHLVQLGASFVDMELYDIAELCRRHGVAVASVRVISDIPGICGPNPRIRIGKALVSAVAERAIWGLGG